MRRRARILHLITRLELGGAQQNTLFSVAHHDRTCFEVALIAGRGGLLDAEAQAIADADVRLVPWLEHPISPGRDVLALVRLVAGMRSRAVDLVHTHSSKAGILGRVAAFLAGVPAIVHTVHGWSFNDTQPAWQRRGYARLERAMAAVTDRLVVVSSGDRARGLAEGIGRERQYVVVRSGIDVERFLRPVVPREAVRAELGVTTGQTLVGTVTCLKPQKAPLDFVEAAALAHRAAPHLRFVIAGDGVLRPQVESRIRELGLEQVVRVLGWRRDVVELLHAMDAFLLTSRFEGLPRVVLQAIAAGVPVIATAVDGTPEVIEDGESGLLVPPAQPSETARRLLELLSQPALRTRIVERARQRLTGSFEIGEMVRQLDGLYLSLLRERGATSRVPSGTVP